MILLKIKKTPYEQEWQVAWMENGRKNEEKTSYHGDPEDAVETAILTWESHFDTEISEDKYTLSLFTKYRPDFSIHDVRSFDDDKWKSFKARKETAKNR